MDEDELAEGLAAAHISSLPEWMNQLLKEEEESKTLLKIRLSTEMATSSHHVLAEELLVGSFHNLHKRHAELSFLNIDWSEPESIQRGMLDIITEFVRQVKEKQTAVEDAATSYNEALSQLASSGDSYDEKLMFLTCVSQGNRKAYFIRSRDKVTNFFRHCGDYDGIPSFVYLALHDSNDVHVFNQHSGVGKTVELCGSAHTRCAHLTIYHQGVKEDEIMPREIQQKIEEGQSFHDARHLVAEEKLKTIICSAIKHNNDVFGQLSITSTSEKELKLVLAIDEASQCRQLVRAIIRHYDVIDKHAAQWVRSEVNDFPDDVTIKVLFSIAGTGAAAADIGSLQDNYTLVKPSIQQDPRKVYKALSKGYEQNLISYDALQSEGPILSKFVYHNARFASIVVKVLAESAPTTETGQLGEGTLIRNVIDKFIRSNGMKEIAGNPAKLAHAGAQALAVHLFQKPANVPTNEDERRQLADSYDYGINLVGDEEHASSSRAMTLLIHKYGLVIANAFDSGSQITTPFIVDDSMQLLAMFLLGVSPKIDLLESSSFGYEVLSTHLAKCAIASTLAIVETERPRVQAALKKVGFQLNASHAGKTQDDFADKELWDKLENAIAVPLNLPERFEKYYDTTQQRQEMSRKKVHKADFPVLISDGTFSPKVANGEEYLLVDKDVIEAISKMEHKPDSLPFFPPLATVAKGSSPYADGYITFFLKVLTGTRATRQSIIKFTIMVQSKDYFDSSIRIKDLLENIERCRSQELTKAFGNERLMCVASRTNKMLVTARCDHFRDFIMYATDKSKILSQLMTTLDEQRNGGLVRTFTGGVSIG